MATRPSAAPLSGMPPSSSAEPLPSRIHRQPPRRSPRGGLLERLFDATNHHRPPPMRGHLRRAAGVAPLSGHGWDDRSVHESRGREEEIEEEGQDHHVEEDNEINSEDVEDDEEDDDDDDNDDDDGETSNSNEDDHNSSRLPDNWREELDQLDDDDDGDDDDEGAGAWYMTASNDPVFKEFYSIMSLLKKAISEAALPATAEPSLPPVAAGDEQPEATRDGADVTAMEGNAAPGGGHNGTTTVPAAAADASTRHLRRVELWCRLAKILRVEQRAMMRHYAETLDEKNRSRFERLCNAVVRNDVIETFMENTLLTARDTSDEYRVIAYVACLLMEGSRESFAERYTVPELIEHFQQRPDDEVSIAARIVPWSAMFCLVDGDENHAMDALGSDVTRLAIERFRKDCDTLRVANSTTVTTIGHPSAAAVGAPSSTTIPFTTAQGRGAGSVRPPPMSLPLTTGGQSVATPTTPLLPNPGRVLFPPAASGSTTLRTPTGHGPLTFTPPLTPTSRGGAPSRSRFRPPDPPQAWQPMLGELVCRGPDWKYGDQDTVSAMVGSSTAGRRQQDLDITPETVGMVVAVSATDVGVEWTAEGMDWFRRSLMTPRRGAGEEPAAAAPPTATAASASAEAVNVPPTRHDATSAARGMTIPSQEGSSHAAATNRAAGVRPWGPRHEAATTMRRPAYITTDADDRIAWPTATTTPAWPTTATTTPSTALPRRRRREEGDVGGDHRPSRAAAAGGGGNEDFASFVQRRLRTAATASDDSSHAAANGGVPATTTTSMSSSLRRTVYRPQRLHRYKYAGAGAPAVGAAEVISLNEARASRMLSLLDINFPLEEARIVLGVIGALADRSDQCVLPAIENGVLELLLTLLGATTFEFDLAGRAIWVLNAMLQYRQLMTRFIDLGGVSVMLRLARGATGSSSSLRSSSLDLLDGTLLSNETGPTSAAPPAPSPRSVAMDYGVSLVLSRLGSPAAFSMVINRCTEDVVDGLIATCVRLLTHTHAEVRSGAYAFFLGALAFPVVQAAFERGGCVASVLRSLWGVISDLDALRAAKDQRGGATGQPPGESDGVGDSDAPSMSDDQTTSRRRRPHRGDNDNDDTTTSSNTDTAAMRPGNISSMMMPTTTRAAPTELDAAASMRTDANVDITPRRNRGVENSNDYGGPTAIGSPGPAMAVTGRSIPSPLRAPTASAVAGHQSRLLSASRARDREATKEELVACSKSVIHAAKLLLVAVMTHLFFSYPMIFKRCRRLWLALSRVAQTPLPHDSEVLESTWTLLHQPVSSVFRSSAEWDEFQRRQRRTAASRRPLATNATPAMARHAVDVTPLRWNDVQSLPLYTILQGRFVGAVLDPFVWGTAAVSSHRVVLPSGDGASVTDPAAVQCTEVATRGVEASHPLTSREVADADDHSSSMMATVELSQSGPAMFLHVAVFAFKYERHDLLHHVLALLRYSLLLPNVAASLLQVDTDVLRHRSRAAGPPVSASAPGGLIAVPPGTTTTLSPNAPVVLPPLSDFLSALARNPMPLPTSSALLTLLLRVLQSYVTDTFKPLPRHFSAAQISAFVDRADSTISALRMFRHLVTFEGDAVEAQDDDLLVVETTTTDAAPAGAAGNQEEGDGRSPPQQHTPPSPPRGTTPFVRNIRQLTIDFLCISNGLRTLLNVLRVPPHFFPSPVGTIGAAAGDSSGLSAVVGEAAAAGQSTLGTTNGRHAPLPAAVVPRVLVHLRVVTMSYGILQQLGVEAPTIGHYLSCSDSVRVAAIELARYFSTHLQPYRSLDASIAQALTSHEHACDAFVRFTTTWRPEAPMANLPRLAEDHQDHRPPGVASSRRPGDGTSPHRQPETPRGEVDRRSPHHQPHQHGGRTSSPPIITPFPPRLDHPATEGGFRGGGDSGSAMLPGGNDHATKSNAAAPLLDDPYREWMRQQIIERAQLQYDNRSLLELVAQHLETNGLLRSALALREEAKLLQDTVETPPPPGMAGSAQEKEVEEEEKAQPSQVAPTGGNTLDRIVNAYVQQQHAGCADPIVTLPPYNLRRPPSCYCCGGAAVCSAASAKAQAAELLPSEALTVLSDSAVNLDDDDYDEDHEREDANSRLGDGEDGVVEKTRQGGSSTAGPPSAAPITAFSRSSPKASPRTVIATSSPSTRGGAALPRRTPPPTPLQLPATVATAAMLSPDVSCVGALPTVVVPNSPHVSSARMATPSRGAARSTTATGVAPFPAAVGSPRTRAAAAGLPLASPRTTAPPSTGDVTRHTHHHPHHSASHPSRHGGVGPTTAGHRGAHHKQTASGHDGAIVPPSAADSWLPTFPQRWAAMPSNNAAESPEALWQRRLFSSSTYPSARGVTFSSSRKWAVGGSHSTASSRGGTASLASLLRQRNTEPYQWLKGPSAVAKQQFMLRNHRLLYDVRADGGISPMSLCFVDHGSLLLVGTNEGGLALFYAPHWDLPDRYVGLHEIFEDDGIAEIRASLPTDVTGQPTFVVLCGAGHGREGDQSVAKVCNLAHLPTVSFELPNIKSLAFSHDTRTMLTTDHDHASHRARLLDFETQRPLLAFADADLSATLAGSNWISTIGGGTAVPHIAATTPTSRGTSGGIVNRWNRANFNSNSTLVLSDTAIFDVRVPYRSAVSFAVRAPTHRMETFRDHYRSTFHPNDVNAVIDSGVWDLRAPHVPVIATVPALEGTIASFDATGRVIYARAVHRHSRFNPFRPENPSAQTSQPNVVNVVDGASFEMLSSLAARARINDFAVDPYCRHVAALFDDDFEDPVVRVFGVGLEYQLGLRSSTADDGFLEDDDVNTTAGDGAAASGRGGGDGTGGAAGSGGMNLNRLSALLDGHTLDGDEADEDESEGSWSEDDEDDEDGGDDDMSDAEDASDEEEDASGDESSSSSTSSSGSATASSASGAVDGTSTSSTTITSTASDAGGWPFAPAAALSSRSGQDLLARLAAARTGSTVRNSGAAGRHLGTRRPREGTTEHSIRSGDSRRRSGRDDNRPRGGDQRSSGEDST